MHCDVDMPVGARGLTPEHLLLGVGQARVPVGPAQLLQRRLVAGLLLGAQESAQLVGVPGRIAGRSDPLELGVGHALLEGGRHPLVIGTGLDT